MAARKKVCRTETAGPSVQEICGQIAAARGESSSDSSVQGRWWLSDDPEDLEERIIGVDVEEDVEEEDPES